MTHKQDQKETRTLTELYDRFDELIAEYKFDIFEVSDLMRHEGVHTAVEALEGANGREIIVEAIPQEPWILGQNLSYRYAEPTK